MLIWAKEFKKVQQKKLMKRLEEKEKKQHLCLNLQDSLCLGEEMKRIQDIMICTLLNSTNNQTKQLWITMESTSHQLVDKLKWLPSQLKQQVKNLANAIITLPKFSRIISQYTVVEMIANIVKSYSKLPLMIFTCLTCTQTPGLPLPFSQRKCPFQDGAILQSQPTTDCSSLEE